MVRLVTAVMRMQLAGFGAMQRRSLPHLFARAALVVGAGPSGAVCSYFLAKGGAKVALLEKETFPRDK
jgi:ribulose 1,5-bisphosphate synthetase/thiazole synthase